MSDVNSKAILKNIILLANKEYEMMLELSPEWMKKDLNSIIGLNNKALLELNRKNTNFTYIEILTKMVKKIADRLNEMQISKN